MEKTKKIVGFGTLAMGQHFRMLARLLAYDLSLYHPEHHLYIITDKPESFKMYKNVKAFNHKFSGVRSCYHDKRFVVKNVLTNCDICIYLDADCRILSPIDFSIFENNDNFILGAWTENLKNKLQKEIANANEVKSTCGTVKGLNSALKKKKIMKSICKILKINFESVEYIHEAFFVVIKSNGNLPKFIESWNYGAKYATLRLFEFSEGSIIGISAVASSSKVSRIKYPDWLYKDIYTTNNKKLSQKYHCLNEMKILRNSIGSEFKTKIIQWFYYPLFFIRYIKCFFK